MAHFAEVDATNKVIRVLVVRNTDAPSEYEGIEFCRALFGQDTRWVQTSYNTRRGVHYGQDGLPDGGIPMRKNYAGAGYVYDIVRDAFIPPKPFESWLLDDFSCLWNPPVPMPDDGSRYMWDEATLSWVLMPTL